MDKKLPEGAWSWITYKSEDGEEVQVYNRTDRSPDIAIYISEKGKRFGMVPESIKPDDSPDLQDGVYIFRKATEAEAKKLAKLASTNKLRERKWLSKRILRREKLKETRQLLVLDKLTIYG